MCLLVVLFKVHPDAPLVVAANRDEFLARPATAMTVLQKSGPRILGGRDEVAGGTWLAVNERGVFAGLTNKPQGRDPGKRSRGELPLALAKHPNAEAAAAHFLHTYRPLDFNPAWILAGDAWSLYYIDISSGERPGVRVLEPGVHVLENRPLGEASPKVERARKALEGVESLRGEELPKGLAKILSDHEIPPEASSAQYPETQAACVHAGPYGTRSSNILLVRESGAPSLSFANGTPCTHPFRDASEFWAG